MIKDSEGRNRVHIQYLQVYKNKKRRSKQSWIVFPKDQVQCSFEDKFGPPRRISKKKPDLVRYYFSSGAAILLSLETQSWLIGHLEIVTRQKGLLLSKSIIPK